MSAFNLPDNLSAKADRALVAGDERHFAAIAESLEQSIAELSDRLDAERKAPGGKGRRALAVAALPCPDLPLHGVSIAKVNYRRERPTRGSG